MTTRETVSEVYRLYEPYIQGLDMAFCVNFDAGLVRFKRGGKQCVRTVEGFIGNPRRQIKAANLMLPFDERVPGTQVPDSATLNDLFDEYAIALSEDTADSATLKRIRRLRGCQLLSRAHSSTSATTPGDLHIATAGIPVNGGPIEYIAFPQSNTAAAIRREFGPDVHIEPGQEEDGTINGRFL